MRSLERKIGAICRAVAVKVAEGHRVPETFSSGQEGGAVCLWCFGISLKAGRSVELHVLEELFFFFFYVIMG